jgi:hypothetical protein
VQTGRPLAGTLQIEGAEQGCSGSQDCWQVEETQWRSIADNLEERLQADGYAVTQLDLEDDTGLRVYEVIKQGNPKYYLHLLSTSHGTVYLVKSKLLSREEFQQMAGV